MDCMIKLIYCILGILSPVFYCCAEYVNPTPGRISIIGSTVIPDGLNLTDSAMSIFRECGFNAGFYNIKSLNDFEEAYSVFSKTNVKLILSSDKLLSDSCEQLVSQFCDNEKFNCWNFIDEPHYDKLTEVKEYYDIIKRINPSKLIMINLIGSPMRQFVGPCNNMRSYLDTIQKIFSPQVWCYDYYPMYVKDGAEKVYRDPFYSDLEVFSTMSKRSGRPFWTYIQSMEFKNSAIERPAAKESYLRFVAFSALGYGAQGLLYWTYGQRYDFKSEEYMSALVNLNGKKSPAWYAAQKVNNEIGALNDVFYNSKLVDCRHTGDILYSDTKKLSGTFGPLKHIVSGNEGVMVSHLKTNGNDYLIIVSRDPFHSQTVRLYFDDVKVEELTVSSSGNNYSVRNKKVSGTVKRSLQPGGYLVFKWN